MTALDARIRARKRLQLLPENVQQAALHDTTVFNSVNAWAGSEPAVPVVEFLAALVEALRREKESLVARLVYCELRRP